MSIRSRLSIVFLVQYFAAGSWIVSLSAYMSKTLGFDAIIASAYSMIGVATIGATLFIGVVVDRFLEAQRVLSFLAFGAAISLFLLSLITNSHWAFLAMMLLHCVFYVSSIPLLATIAFNAIEDPAQDYPRIRVFGSVGWIFAGLLVGTIPGAGQSRLPMLIGAATYLAQSLFALTLPRTPPRASNSPLNIAGLFGLDVLRRVKSKSFWVFMFAVFFVTTPKRFYDSFANNFLVEKGMSFSVGGLTLEPTAIQTLGQIAEVPALLLIPFLIRRVGIKYVMLLGMFGWILRFVLFALGFHGVQALPVLLLVGILMHGVSYDLLLVAGQIYLDRLFDPATRGRVQAFYWFVLSGVGVIFGSLVAGWVYRKFTADGLHDWTSIWLAPSALTLVIALLFTWGFREPGRGVTRSASNGSI
jgi:nucleoside transporter